MDTNRSAEALHALRVLGDPTRRRIFERLLGGPLPVQQIADGLPVTRPAVSQHLRVLLDAGLVTVRSEGRRRVYAVRPDGIQALREVMDAFWERALEAFRAAAAASAASAAEERKGLET